MNPIVSICIANYNGIDFIDACIESVQAQDCRFAYEIIVHDDASMDGSAAHIRTHHPDVRLIESSDNVGFCIANNRMAEVAGGEYFLLLNNDAALETDALQTLYAEATHLDRPAILGLAQYDSDSGKLLDIGSLLDPFLNPVPNTNAQRSDVGMVMGACFWIPKVLWKTLGGFPEWFGSIAEDLYLCCAARLTGFPVRALGNSGFNHQVGRSFGGGKVTTGGRLVTTMNRRALTERNKTFTLVITYPAALLAIVLPLHLAALHLEGLLLTLLTLQSEIWRKIYAPVLPSLWHERQRLLWQRRHLQRRRSSTVREFLAPFRWLPRKLEMLWLHGFPEVRAKK